VPTVKRSVLYMVLNQLVCVSIPFQERFIIPMESGIKTKTSRNKKYGEVGNIFINNTHIYQITEIERMELGVVAKIYYRQEGFNSPQEFIDCWVGLHPREGFVPNQKVWVHSFKRYYG